MELKPKKLLIIHFGQIGDVILGLPAFEAIRNKFPDSEVTALVGKTARVIVEMSGLTDKIIVVDRYDIRDGGKLKAPGKILKLISQIRREKFGFVVDLHSLFETNLLGYFSGAKLRLYSNRGNRSLNFLSNFEPKPPGLDQTGHLTDNYLQTLAPLGLANSSRLPSIEPDREDIDFVSAVFEKDGIDKCELIGLNPGAGNPSREWSLEKYSELAALLSEDESKRVVVFLGPEERIRQDEIVKSMPAGAFVYSDFDLKQLAAACTLLKVFVCNDSGPIHLAAAVGTPTVLVAGHGGLKFFRPAGKTNYRIENKSLEEIEAEDILELTNKAIAAGKSVS